MYCIRFLPYCGKQLVVVGDLLKKDPLLLPYYIYVAVINRLGNSSSHQQDTVWSRDGVLITAHKRIWGMVIFYMYLSFFSQRDLPPGKGSASKGVYCIQIPPNQKRRWYASCWICFLVIHYSLATPKLPFLKNARSWMSVIWLTDCCSFV